MRSGKIIVKEDFLSKFQPNVIAQQKSIAGARESIVVS